MFSKKFALQALAVAALAVSASASHAAFTLVTNSLSAFNAATFAPGTDTFTGFNITGSTPSPITRSAGAYGYTAAASTSSFFGAGTTANPWLSTNNALDSVLFNTFTGGGASGIKGIGGNFFGSDITGSFSSGNITLVAVDSLGATSTQIITAATVGSFLGFVTNGVITSLTLSAVQGVNPLWPTADNLVLAIPEPGTYALMFAGLAAVGAMVRRRKA